MLALIALAATNPACAYKFAYDPQGVVQTPYRWELPAYTAAVNTASFSTVGPFQDPIERGILAWDQSNVPGSRLATSVTTTFQSTLDVNDQINSVSAIVMMELAGPVLNTDYFPCVTLGETEVRYSNDFLGFGANHIKEADILVDVDCNWGTPDPGEYYDILDQRQFDDEIDIEQVILHEAGHAVGLEEELGISEEDAFDILINYEGWPATMQPALSGGSVYDDGFLERRYVANEDDREGIRDLYIPLASAAVDWAAQSYQVYDDDVLLAVAGDGCDGALGRGATRPDPAVDVLAVAQDLGEAYGDCPSPWTTPPVAPLGSLDLYNGTFLNVQFTLNNLGAGGGDVKWQVLFTDDLADTDCSTSGCWIAYEDTSSIGAGTPWEHDPITIAIPMDAPIGNYYVQLVMDSDNAWPNEDDEANNTAVWNRQVHVLGPTSCGCRTTGPSAPTAMVALLGLVAIGRRRRG